MQWFEPCGLSFESCGLDLDLGIELCSLGLDLKPCNLGFGLEPSRHGLGLEPCDLDRERRNKGEKRHLPPKFQRQTLTQILYL